MPMMSRSCEVPVKVDARCGECLAGPGSWTGRCSRWSNRTGARRCCHSAIAVAARACVSQVPVSRPVPSCSSLGAVRYRECWDYNQRLRPYARNTLVLTTLDGPESSLKRVIISGLLPDHRYFFLFLVSSTWETKNQCRLNHMDYSPLAICSRITTFCEFSRHVETDSGPRSSDHWLECAPSGWSSPEFFCGASDG